jgi:hypothetical protein
MIMRILVLAVDCEGLARLAWQLRGYGDNCLIPRIGDVLHQLHN